MGTAPTYRAHLIQANATMADARQYLAAIAGSDSATAPAPGNRPLVLYGAGNLGKMAKNYLQYVGVPFAYVVDANPAAFQSDPDWEGISVVGGESVPDADKNDAILAVCISTLPYVPIHQSLTVRGWKHVVPFYDIAEAFRDRHPLGNGWFAGKLGDDDRTACERVMGMWADDTSRSHHIQFLAWRCLREEWVFSNAPVVTDNRYFIPHVAQLLGPEECFLDVGAHHGETSIRFVEQVNGHFRQIVCIEPDGTNIQVLKKNVQTALSAAHLRKLEIIEAVVAEQTGHCSFIDGLGYASQRSPLGSPVPVTALDDLAVTPTYIKLHLEGGELEALRGAENTLRAARPIIAATGYHNSLGIWRLPLWLMETLPDYRFMLRLHGWCGTGLVIYALPNERTSARTTLVPA